MKPFQAFLAFIFFSILSYTAIVVGDHGWTLFPVFFGDMQAMTWSGQFNMDFMSHLMLSGIWLAWRNQFSKEGIILGLLGSVGGILVLAPYLFIMSFKVNGDMKELLLGKARAR